MPEGQRIVSVRRAAYRVCPKGSISYIVVPYTISPPTLNPPSVPYADHAASL
jgi:hypothetical protein